MSAAAATCRYVGCQNPVREGTHVCAEHRLGQGRTQECTAPGCRARITGGVYCPEHSAAFVTWTRPKPTKVKRAAPVKPDKPSPAVVKAEPPRPSPPRPPQAREQVLAAVEAGPCDPRKALPNIDAHTIRCAVRALLAEGLIEERREGPRGVIALPGQLPPSLAERALAFIAAADAPVSVGEVVAGLDASAFLTSRALRLLVEEGRIARRGSGAHLRYVVAEPAEAA